jgi:transcriptional regulator with XRE-family HTH domain
MHKNRLRSYREAQLLTKAELARKAGISTLTIDRIEAGMPSRMDTMRKIILALGLKVTDKHKLFGAGADEDEEVVAVSSARRRTQRGA